jgi:glycosyltransferase involved in cell wall biosynthesis
MTPSMPGASAPAVSVLMTAYNRERYIGEAIQSVLAQTFTDFELIVCDDASNDRTVEIANGYARADRRVRVVVNDANVGDFANRRLIASFARGRFLRYHDSDDVMYRHCLATVVEPLSAEPTAGFALSGGHHWPGGPCPMLLTPALAYEREFLGSGLFHLGPASALFRAEVYHDLGGFPDAGVASDYLFWLRACARVNTLLVPADLFYYRIHPGQQLTSRNSALDYAKARRVAWEALNSGDCPLRGAALEQAKRNFVFTIVREAYHHARLGRYDYAAAALSHVGIGAGGWLRYLRRPRRSTTAGTPAVGASAGTPAVRG